MKKLLLLLPFIALLLLIGCSNQDQTAPQREEFQRQMESQLSEFDQRIAEGRNQAEELTGDARANMEQTIDGLEKQRADLAAKLEEMKAVGDDEWEASKTEVEQASEDLQQALSDLQGKIEDATSQN
jgi:TPP-dependent trihydroxycyclohexane-1,2-dione (THcHDO) dehydratase